MSRNQIGARAHHGKALWWMVVALVVAGLMATAGWLWWSQPEQGWTARLAWPASTEALEQTVADMGVQMQGLEQQVDRLSDQLDAQQEAVGRMQTTLRSDIDVGQQRSDQRLADALETVGRLQARIERLQAEQDEVISDLREQGQALPRLDRSVMRRLGLVEAAALLALGQQRLELADDRAGAATLYGQAAAQLRAMDDASLNPVVRQIQREQAAIEAAPALDWALWQDRVLQLQAMTRSWTGGEIADKQPEAVAEAPDQRWRQRVQQGVGALVTVRPRDETGQAEIDHSLRQQQLSLWLDAALLALYQHDAERVRDSADRAKSLWPGGEDSEAMVWLAALAELQEPTLEMRLGTALQRLRAEIEMPQ